MKKNSKKFKFSIIMCIYKVEEYLREAVDSVIAQNIGFKENIQIILVNDGSPDNCDKICKEYAKKYPNNFVYVEKKNGGLSDAKNTGLKYIEGEFINFMDPDDIISKNTLREVYSFMKNNPEIDLAAIPLEFFEARTGLHPKYEPMGKQNRVIDLDEEPHNYISSSASTFYKKEVISNKKFDVTMVGGEDTKFNCELYKRNKKIGYVCENGVVYHYRRREAQTSIVDSVSQNPKGYISLANRMKMFNPKKLEKYEQEVIIYELRSFLKKLDSSIFDSEKDFNEVKNTFKKYVNAIDANYILNDSYWADTIDYKCALLKMKECNLLELIDNGTFKYSIRVNLYRTEIKNNKIILEVLFNNFETKEIELVLENEKGKIYPASEAKDLESRFDLYFGEHKIDNTHYRKFEIPIKEKDFFKFKLRIKDKCYPTKRININKNSKLPLGSKSVGIRTNNKIVKITKDGIRIGNYTRSDFMYKIITTLKLCVKSRKLLLWRLLSFKNKKYILINDRPEKACDNGEAIFKYINKKRPDLAKYTYFVMDNNNIDYQRLKKYGKVVKLNSLKHKFLYLNATKILTSHNAPLFYKAFPKTEKYYKDLMDYEYVWLQHGITYNDVSEGANRLHKGFDKVIVVANMEKKEFSKEKYMINEEDIILAGFPRFDYLENKPQNIITIAPTWRRSLTGNVKSDGSHETVDGYEESLYHQTYKKLLTSKKIKKLLKDNKYIIQFVIHPGMMGYIDHFYALANEYIKIIPPQEVIYSDIFSQSKLLITDYSSIFFDFAYLKKPEIFFQFDKEEFYSEHYHQSDFEHEKDAFGDVVKTVEELENKIEEYFNNNFQMEKKYIKRVEKTFAKIDRNNCKRTIEAIFKSE